MFPEKHVEEKLFKHRKKVFYRYLAVSAVFAVSYLFLGPLIHETSHILVLMLKSCGFNIEPGFNWLDGFRASVDPFCALRGIWQKLFFISGYSSTFLVGLLFYWKGYISHGFKRKAWFSFSSGVLISLLADLGLRGDLSSGMGEMQLLRLLFTSFVTVVVMALSFLMVEKVHQNGRNDTETIP